MFQAYNFIVSDSNFLIPILPFLFIILLVIVTIIDSKFIINNYYLNIYSILFLLYIILIH